MTSTRTLPGLPRLVPVLTLGLLLAAAPRATAQRPTNPDSAQQAQMTSMMGPMMGQMMEAMMEGMLRVMSKPESAERLATFTHNYYSALIRKGFTKEEALQIVIAAGLPKMPSGMR